MTPMLVNIDTHAHAQDLAADLAGGKKKKKLFGEVHQYSKGDAAKAP